VIPEHDGLGDIVTEEVDEDGYVFMYRPCSYRWSHSNMRAYEKQHGLDFDWCVTGANPVWGVSRWVKQDELKEASE